MMMMPKGKKVKCGWKGKKIVAAVDAARIYLYIHNNTAYNSNRIFVGGNEKFLYIFCMYTYWNVLRLTHFNMNLK